MKQNPVVHFEMPALDKKRTKKFYETVFGWDMKQLGPEMGEYLLAGTTPVDDKNMAISPGAINGGFFQKGEQGVIPHIIISVDNLEEHIEIVKQNGGTVLGTPMGIPGIGKFVMLIDTEGNHVGMLQPPEM